MVPLMIVLAYLLGSISSAVLVCKLKGLPDPRYHGSNNPGATNVLRLGGKAAAVMVLLFDVLKGTIPVWTGYYLGIDPLSLAFIGIAACLGHIYPVFFGFKGGKGVATALGALAPISDWMGLLIIATWLVIVFITQYASLGAVLTSMLAPLYTYLIKPQYTLSVALLCLLIIWRHQDNLVRLWQGKEPKVSERIKRKRDGHP
ncbi:MULTISPECIES: glycerol-3-phosphate 1-O-acyltransferase PlsY [Ferrimonas]|uniref:glycerol-3-phosphate 1-O-acyltransferase PlsY n=1 Tax=Ferrimonas TaxID=44011 RepID=UPI00041CFA02|nr:MULTISPECIES: glycerol-3-phosphate 1-O-acyltransferase PlsY [Ferrimonas]USD37037.1 glycerol-3-phosphate 1-O-acyltransferase PlsY [Ferrimonas sp. SCSIO 43195]